MFHNFMKWFDVAFLFEISHRYYQLHVNPFIFLALWTLLFRLSLLLLYDRYLYRGHVSLFNFVCWKHDLIVRRWILERKLADAEVSEEEQSNLLKYLEQKETEYMRLQRHKMGVDDFKLLTIIGRGAFGEVVIYIPTSYHGDKWICSEKSPLYLLIFELLHCGFLFCALAGFWWQPFYLHFEIAAWPLILLIIWVQSFCSTIYNFIFQIITSQCARNPTWALL